MFAEALRARMLEMNLLGRPAGTQALAEHVEKHAERQLSILSALEDRGRRDLIFEASEPVLSGEESHQRTLLVEWEQIDKGLERAAQGLGRDRGIAPHAETARAEAVAEPQAEIVVAGAAGCSLEQGAEGGKPEAQGG